MQYIYTVLRRLCLLVIMVIGTHILYAQQLTDRAIKINIETIENPLQRLIQLNPHKFEYNVNGFRYLKLKEGTQFGFVTEDMEAIFPHLVNEKQVSYMFGKNVYRNAKIKMIDEAGLIPVLVASIKEQQVEIEKLKEEILKLKQQTAFKD
ncbi:MAG: tail fiber domain-containing protein [Agriterribacter sp.]